jgi:hypothetical protein
VAALLLWRVVPLVDRQPVVKADASTGRYHHLCYIGAVRLRHRYLASSHAATGGKPSAV